MENIYFSNEKHGYNKKEVETFILKLNDEYLRLQKEHNAEIKRLKAEIAHSQNRLSEETEKSVEYREMCELVGEKALAAQRIADEIIECAKVEAQRIHAEAGSAEASPGDTVVKEKTEYDEIIQRFEQKRAELTKDLEMVGNKISEALSD